MRAVLCREWGEPERLVVENLPDPAPQPGEAIVRVTAASLNFADSLVIARKYQMKPELPFSPGAEIAGVVEALGAGVSAPAIGTRVIAYLGVGGARERVAVKAGLLIPIPDGLDEKIAAGLLVAYGTTLHAYRQRARLKAGETVAILGASGGVGQAAIEIGRILGARVIAVASPDKLDFCRSLGADIAIPYEDGGRDLKAQLRDLTNGRGVDVVYDAVGGQHTELAIRALAWKGRLLVVGFAAGDIPRPPINLLLLRGCDMLGVNWPKFMSDEPEESAANNAEILDFAARGLIRPHIHAVVGLEDTPRAIRMLMDRSVKGKIVVAP